MNKKISSLLTILYLLFLSVTTAYSSIATNYRESFTLKAKDIWLQKLISVEQPYLTDDYNSSYFLKTIHALLSQNLESQRYWKKLIYSPFKKYITSSPTTFLNTMIKKNGSIDDKIKEHINNLEEMQSLLAHVIYWYKTGNYFTKEIEQKFLDYYKQQYALHQAHSWVAQHWITFASSFTTLYIFYRHKNFIRSTIQNYMAKTTNSLKEFAEEFNHANDQIGFSLPIPTQDIITLESIKQSILTYYKDTKNNFLKRKNDYHKTLITHVKELFKEQGVQVNPEHYTINQLKTIRDSAHSITEPLGNKINIFLKTKLYASVYLNKLITPERISLIDQTYLDSLQAEAYYYVETGKASGKALLATYLTMKAAKTITKGISFFSSFFYHLITKKPSFTLLKNQLKDCERLLNHARNKDQHNPFYEGMLLYFIILLEAFSTKIPTTWKERFNNGIEDLKNHNLSFEQKHTVTTALIRDYAFLQD